MQNYIKKPTTNLQSQIFSRKYEGRKNKGCALKHTLCYYILIRLVIPYSSSGFIPTYEQVKFFPLMEGNWLRGSTSWRERK